MKKAAVVLIGSLISSYSFAATKWTNCPMAVPAAQAVAEVFWKSDVNGENGPTYNLPGGQTLDNAGVVCAKKKIDDLTDWEKELKSGINPAKSVTSFKMIKNSEEFRSFLEAFGTTVNDQNSLDRAVSDFLEGKSSIVVGSSSREAVILLAKSDGNGETAMFLQIKKN